MIGLIVVPTTAILNRLGGSVSHFFRRLGIGIELSVFGMLSGVHVALCLLLAVCNFIVTSLPITLIGDEIITDARTKIGFDRRGIIELSIWISFPTKWINLIWIYILGILWGLVPCTLNIHHYLFCLPYAFLFGTSILLSNLKRTAEIFKWQYIELFIGAMTGLLTYLVIHV